MHVLFASHRYSPVPGGSERIAQVLAEGVVRRGDRATVITRAEPGTPTREVLNGVEVIRIRTRPMLGVRFPSGYLRLLRRSEADVFHLHGNRIWCADFYFPVARLFSWPQLVTGHGFYQYAMNRRWVDRWYFERYLPRVLRAFDAYVCDTEYERNQLLGWGVTPGRLPRIPLGADLDEFRESPIPVETIRARWQLKSPLVALYVGGFFENKRVDRLVEAIARSNGPWALVAIGQDIPDSPYNVAYCRRLAERLGVELRVEGALPRPETVGAFFACDAVVSASAYEGFGVTLAEAMAAGRPFVAWDTGAAPEMAAAGGGTLVRSVSELSSALSTLSDPAVRREVGARGRTASRDWSFQSMAERYGALYRQLAARSARA